MSKTRSAVTWLAFLAAVTFTVVQLPGLAGRFYYEVGMLSMRRQDYGQAEGALRRSTLLAPWRARGHVDLGDALLRLKRYDEAEASFRTALRLEDESCAHCGLGAVHFESGRYEEAERSLRRAAELSPNDECAYDWSGRMFYQLERYEEAAKAFEHEVRLLPRAVLPLHFLGNSYGYLGRHEEAAGVYLRIIALRPDYQEVHYQLGVAYSQLKRYRDAVSAYRRALELRRDDGGAVYGLALAHSALGEGRSAAAYHERLRSLDPAAAAELLRRMDCRTPRRDVETRGRPRPALISGAWWRVGVKCFRIKAYSVGRAGASSSGSPFVPFKVRPKHF